MRNTTMFVLLSIVLTGLLVTLAASIALADGSGSAATVLVDPATNPLGAFDQIVAFAHQNIGLGIGAIVYVAAKLLAKVPKFAALDNGRVALVLGGISAVGYAVLTAVLAGMPMQSALIEGVVAIGTYWHPAAQAVAKGAKA